MRSGKRLFVVGGCFAVCFGVLAIRAVTFQLKDDAQLERVALRQYRTAVRRSTHRGKILDAAGRELAIDVQVPSIYANPLRVTEPVKAAGELARLLHVDRRRLLDRLSSRRKFIWVKRRVDEEDAQAVENLGLEGVSVMQESARSYPGKTLAANVLGAVGFDAEPLGGVELALDERLSSRTNAGVFKRDARGHLYLSPADTKADGIANVELTIDRTLQFIVERELARGVKEAHAKGGTAIVVDVRTGDILAMANRPTFDPNDYGSYALSHWRNRAIADAYEPGSTFKVIVVAAALDAGVVTADEVLDCENGRIRIGDDIVRDAHPQDKLTVADIVKVSSNIGAYKIERRMEPAFVERAIRRFGFGDRTELGLPGESGGILTGHDQWSPLQFATIAFGQGIAATPLQMTMAFAAIANGGRLLRPHIVRRVLGEEGGVVEERAVEVVSRPIRPETAVLMTTLLKRVVEEDGTGSLAASFEYPVAGKTGTAQKADPKTGGYAKGRYYSSFVGFAPADDPLIAVYVGIDEPRGAFYYGGQVAAPLFRTIVEEVLHYRKVPAVTVATSEEVRRQLPPPAAQHEIPTVVNRDREALRRAKLALVEETQGSWRLPDLTGLTMRGVLEASRDADIQWRFEGSGLAVSQRPAPGSVVEAGSECTVRFQPML